MKNFICLIFTLYAVVSISKGKEPYNLMGKSNIQYKDTVPCIAPSAKCYWFYVKPRFDKKLNNFKIRVLNKTPKSGLISAYEKEVWRKLQNGDQILIGSFNTIKDAENSMLYYQIASGLLDSTIVNSEEEVYWNKLYWGYTARTHSIVYDRDYEVQKGKRTDYIQELKTSLQKNILLVGPWSDYQYFEQIRPKPRRCTAFDNE